MMKKGQFFLLAVFMGSFLGKGVAEQLVEPSFERPTSQLATEGQFYSPEYAHWCQELKDPVRIHRKQWEYCYILQVLNRLGCLKPGKKGLGFGVGQEPLPSLFAKYGCQVVASDQDFGMAQEQGWVSTGQFLNGLEALNSRQICPDDQFKKLVSCRSVDMNAIDPHLKGFDFVWSSCSFEHLGSLELGADFVKNSIKCLKKGGVAIHTTEYNISSNHNTVTSGPTVIYRRQDIEKLVADLTEMGCEVLPVNYYPGVGELDHYVDVPPYLSSPHIKLRIGEFVTTSIGLVIIKR